MVKVRGSCDKPFKRYSWLKNLLCERLQGTSSWRHWAIENLSKCADSSHFTFFHFVLMVMHLHFGAALHILAGENYIIIIIYSYLSRDIPTDLSVFLQGALTKYIIECVDHEVMWHCEYQEEQSSTWQQLNMIVSVSRNGEKHWEGRGH